MKFTLNSLIFLYFAVVLYSDQSVTNAVRTHKETNKFCNCIEMPDCDIVVNELKHIHATYPYPKEGNDKFMKEVYKLECKWEGIHLYICCPDKPIGLKLDYIGTYHALPSDSYTDEYENCPSINILR